MKLPNGERADLGEKLEQYVLDPRHWRGRHKARVFASVLGITRDNQEILESALREAGAIRPMRFRQVTKDSVQRLRFDFG